MTLNDDERFALLWRENYADVLAFIRRRVPDVDLAADIAAETFLVAWRRSIDIPDAPRAWLFGVARNLIANALRATQRRGALLERLRTEPLSLRSVGPGDTDSGPAAEAFGGLSLSDRETLALVAWDGLKPGEAAAVLGIPAARFSVRLFRAKQRFSRALTDAETLRASPQGRRELLEEEA